MELEEIRAAVNALNRDEAEGRLSAAEATRRINGCRSSVTKRDLWKASGKRGGSRKRSDWKDIRGAVYGLVFLFILAVVGVYGVTIVIGESVGDNGVVPGVTIVPSPPT